MGWELGGGVNVCGIPRFAQNDSYGTAGRGSVSPRYRSRLRRLGWRGNASPTERPTAEERSRKG